MKLSNLGFIRKYSAHNELVTFSFEDDTVRGYLISGEWLEDYIHTTALRSGYDEVLSRVLLATLK